jgi:hypothetical protein
MKMVNNAQAELDYVGGRRLLLNLVRGCATGNRAIGVARIIALVDPKGGDPDGPKAVKCCKITWSMCHSAWFRPPAERWWDHANPSWRNFLKN